MSVTIEDLDNTVSQIKVLADKLRCGLYPKGKPDWMPQEDWDKICPKEGDVE